MKKTIYQVTNPFGNYEYEINIKEVDINYVINTITGNQFDTLEEAKKFIVKTYESKIEETIVMYKYLMINIEITK